jgi:tetratricopeptide (TPR) repeat protein
MSAGLIAGVLLGLGVPPAPGLFDAPEPKRDALARYGAALWQGRRERLLTAAKSFEAAAKQDPNAAAPLRELVRVYSLLGREPEAIRAARAVLEKDPEDADTAHALARLLHDAGELKEAAAAAKQALDSPRLADRPVTAVAVARDLAAILTAAGDHAGAADALRKAVDLLAARRKKLPAGTEAAHDVAADLADTWERLGKALTKKGAADGAAVAFRAAHKLYADPAAANDPASAARLDWNLSGAFAAKGDPATALIHLERFLKLGPQAADPFLRWADLLRKAGRGGEVVPALRAQLTRDPKNAPLRTVLAAELARVPETRRGADDLFAELADVADPKLVRLILKSHVETGRPGRVLADLDRCYEAVAGDDPKMAAKRAAAADRARAVADVLRAEPEWAAAVLRAAADDLRAGTKHHFQTVHLAAVLAARHRRLELAEVLFRQAARNPNPDTVGEAYTGLIDVLWKARKPAAVAEVCRDAIRAGDLGPWFFQYHLAGAAAELGDADEALAAADKAVAAALPANRLAAQLRKVYVLSTTDRADDAVALCRTLLDGAANAADRARVRYALAGALWAAKKHSEAEAELRAVLDADPDHAGAANDLGYHLADQGRNLDEAERLVRHAIAADAADRRKAADPDPHNAAYLDSLGWVLFRRGKHAEAKEWLGKAAALPDGAADGTVHDHLGDVCFRLGDKPAAKAHWEAALGLYATDARAKRDGRPDEVKRKLNRIP